MNLTNQRTAYGETLVELGAENKNIVALEADLGKSTMSYMFQQAYPERYFEMGIAEANMASVAAGLAQTGKIPFIHSFAVFATGRSFDQIRQTIAIGKLNVKICGSSAGCSDFGDGATHQSVEDIAIMSAIPNMTVFSPADANETVKAVREMAAIDGPCYIRINRNTYENMTSPDDPFVVGVPTVLREGTDVAVFATGHMCVNALEAARVLEGKLSIKVINVSTIKPMDYGRVLELIGGCKAVVTAEEHSIIGGLGSAVARALGSRPLPMEMVGVEDIFGCSGHSYDEVLEYLGLTTEHVVESVEKAFANQL